MVAVTADKVVVELEARLSAYNSQVEASRRKFTRSMDDIGRSGRGAEALTRRNFRDMGAAIAAVEGPLGGVAGRFRSFNTIVRDAGAATAVAALGFGALAVGATQVAGLADKYTRFENRLKTAGVAAEDMTAVQDKLFASANKNGVEIEALGSVYARASLSATALGASQQQLDTFVGAVSDGLRVQGSSAEQSRGALLQLSQTLGQDIVRAEEFNSLMEGALPIAQAAAKGIGRFEGSVAKLRTAIINGEVTSREFFQGILSQAPALAKQAAAANLTLENSFTALYNQLARGIGQTNNSLGATEKLSEGIIYLANNLGTLGEALTVITAAIGSRMVASLIAAGAEQAKFYAGVAAGNTVIIGGKRAAEQKAAAEKAGAVAVLESAQAEKARSLALVQGIEAEIAAQVARRKSLGAGVFLTDQGKSNYLKREAELSRDLAAAKRLLAASSTAEAAASTTATVATNAHAVALGRTAIASRAAGVAMRAYAALSGLLGGPLGIALTALAGIYLIVSHRTAEAAERTNKLQAELRSLGYLAPETTAALEDTAAALSKLADDQIRKKIEETKQALDDLTGGHFTFFADFEKMPLDEVASYARQLTIAKSISDDVGKEIQDIVAELKNGTLPADQLNQRLAKIASLDLGKGVDNLIASLRNIGPTVDAAARRLKALVFAQEGGSPGHNAPYSREASRSKERATAAFLASRAIGAEARALDARTKSILSAAKAAKVPLTQDQARAQAQIELAAEAGEKTTKTLQKQTNRDVEVVRDLHEQIAAFGNARNQAIRSAVDRLPNDPKTNLPDPSRVTEVTKLAGQLYDMAALSNVERDKTIQSYKDEAEQIGVVKGALVEMQFVQQRMNQFRADGIPITQEITDKTHEQARAVRQVYEELEKTNEPLRNQIQVTDALRQGFIDVGIAGVDGFDGIVDAAVSAIKQVAQLILQLYVLKPLMEGLLGPVGSPATGVLGSLFGAGASSAGASAVGAAVSDYNFGSIPGFADGTSNTGGPRGKVRGVVHGQEAVIPLPNGGRIPVELRMPVAMKTASAPGGAVAVYTTVNITEGQAQTQTRGSTDAAGRQLANMIEQNVKSIMQREKRQGGLLWNPGGR